MSNPTPNAPCAEHPERMAVAACDRCGRPVCEECKVELVAAERVYCSQGCREVSIESVDNATLRAGLEKPIRIGWSLWVRSMGPIAAIAFSVAIVAAPLIWYLEYLELNSAPGEHELLNLFLLVALLVVVGFGVALVGTTLSKRYAGLAIDPRAQAARRLIPWIGTWALLFPIILVGYIALIFPGIYLSLRLFWADEFALIHDKGPIAALKASWELTRNEAFSVFVFQFVLGFAQYVILLPAVFFWTAVLGGLESIGWSGLGYLSIADAFVFIFVFLFAYGGLHGPELVKFYGMRAERANWTAAVG